ncbi:MAG: DHH family phosphoesterase [Endomicrobiia bacterium]
MKLHQKINKKICKKFFEKIKQSKSIFITGHVNPDADVIGSALAIYLWINKIFPKKDIDVIFRNNLPHWLNFLPNFDKIKVCGDKLKKNYDLGIILECSEISRIGEIINFNQLKFVVNIDHHLNNHNKRNVYNLNFTNSTYASCAEILFDIFETLKVKLDNKIATCLYVGIVTDTGKFQWSNTNQHSFYTAMKLLSYGIKPYEIYKNLFRQKSYNSMLLLSKVLSTMQIVKIGNVNVGIIKASYNMFSETKTTVVDTEDFVNFPMDVAGTNVSVFLREDKPNVVKVSFRSGSVDVEKIARHFGGGGHKFASGATIEGNIEDVKNEVLKVLKNYLDK